MVQLHFGGKTGRSFNLEPTDDFLVVRTKMRTDLVRAPMTARSRGIVESLAGMVNFLSAGVQIVRSNGDEQIRIALKAEEVVEFAGRALVEPGMPAPIAYTENIFLKLHDDLSPSDVAAALLTNLRHGLVIKRRLDFARNAYFLAAPKGVGLAIFEIAEELLALPEVELCHPEIVRERASKQAYPPQWHLFDTSIGGAQINQSANVADAWAHSRGKGVVIAVIDDGVDIDHPEFTVAGKLTKPRDVTLDSNDPRPRYASDRHGTACAGVAAAAGVFGASGVAPDAQLMPIRLSSGLGSMDEAEAFYWAAKNGADVISCSWGPTDGEWWNPDDPLHELYVPLPDNTRLAIDAAADQGRNGRGCVILFAAGNGNESVDNDGYASYEKIIAVAASNDHGTRSSYSDMGKAIWCAFPSSHGEPSLTPGIWTTDRRGALGYNDGKPSLGDKDGMFTNSFGGTSSACPGAAGVAALILAANPWLTRTEVRDILKDSCDQIDKAGGQYDAAGHSPLYGWGRLNAERAVALAMGRLPAPALNAATVVSPKPLKPRAAKKAKPAVQPKGATKRNRKA